VATGAPLRAALPALLAAATAAAGGFVAGERLGGTRAPATTIEIVACGLAPGPPTIELPLDQILHQAGPIAVGLGPFALGGVAEPVTIRFKPVPASDEKTPRRDGGAVTLPVHVDRPDRLERVTLRCRYGEPTRVAYRYGAERLELPVLPDPGARAVPAR
jgi:hypothetical protein